MTYLLMKPRVDHKGSPRKTLVQDTRGVLCVVTKTLAAYQLACAPVRKEHHLNGMERRHTHMENSSVRIPREGGHTCVTLSFCILTKDTTALTGVDTLSQAYHKGREYLTDWQPGTARMYPDLGNKAVLMTDT